ncbi:MAG: nickel pincer cofactor biosynthesis protein LarC [Armatimonadota bacterium]
MTIAYLDVFFGISGDMTLSALVDAGVDPEDMRNELKRLHLDGWDLSFERIVEKGIGATRATVTAHEHSDEHHGHDHGHHSHGHGMKPGELIEIIEASDLQASVKQRARAMIERVAEAEAAVHQKPVEEIHFHELGGLDTVIDVVGAVVGFDLLGVEKIHSSPIPLTHGFVDTAHGRLAVPVPAVVEILKGIPTRPLDVDGETVTPTGAAIAVTLAESFGPPPEMTLTASGFGAGHKEFSEGANLLRIMVGEAEKAPQTGDTQILVEANIDDMNPELYEPVRQAIFEAGAVDCWFEPIYMKKNRPAVKLSALVLPAQKQAVAEAIVRNSTTFGVRMTTADRFCLEREIQQVQTPYGTVGMKIGRLDDAIVTVTPEFDDCMERAAEADVPVRLVYQAAQALAHQLIGDSQEAT